MNVPVFSIIIPTLNSEADIARSIESVLNQTFKDFEILVLDGVSKDKTLQIANNYNDRRIRVFSEKDRGIYDAMNKGVALAQGIWLYFLGSDDVLYSNDTLQSFIRGEFDAVDVVYGNVYSTRFNGIYDGQFNEKKIMQKNICHQAIFFRRAVFHKIGNFDLKYKAYADWDHNMRWFLSGKVRYTYTAQVIAGYADGGFSSNSSDLKFKEEKNFKYLVYASGFLPMSKRLHLTIRELRQSLMKRNVSLLITILLNVPTILFATRDRRQIT